jgi:dTMP kinase
VFITFEGPDGAGKTTQAELLARRLHSESFDVIALREPGGTDLGSAIREILVRRNWTPIDSRAEALLFAACRAQLVAEVIRPALARGAVVVADRFADSTRAYQGAGRGLPEAELESLIAIATQGLIPDLTLLLDVPIDVGRSRLEPPELVQKPPAVGGRQIGEAPSSSDGWNRFEDEAIAFHERVRAAYLDLARREPKRWAVLDACQPVDLVSAAIWETVWDRNPSALLPGSPRPG